MTFMGWTTSRLSGLRTSMARALSIASQMVCSCFRKSSSWLSSKSNTLIRQMLFGSLSTCMFLYFVLLCVTLAGVSRLAKWSNGSIRRWLSLLGQRLENHLLTFA